MGMFDRNRPVIGRNTTFRLSEIGRERLSNLYNSGNQSDRVLAAMECLGSAANADEISRSAHMSRGQVELLLSGLLKGGMVNNASSGSSMMSEGN